LSPSQVPQAVGVLLGTPSTQACPLIIKEKSWVTLGNFSQYLFVKDQAEAVAEKLGSGQSLRGISLFVVLADFRGLQVMARSLEVHRR